MASSETMHQLASYTQPHLAQVLLATVRLSVVAPATGATPCRGLVDLDSGTLTVDHEIKDAHLLMTSDTPYWK